MPRAALGAALILSAVLAGGCTPDYPTTQADYVPLALHVPDDYGTVTAALLASLPGDTVLVAAGTYEESYVPLAAGVLLRGETGRAGGVRIDSTTVTLRDCVIEGNVSKTSGGGVTCGNYGQVILEDCLIGRNSAGAYRGGGLWLGGAVTGNLGRTRGGGVYLEGWGDFRAEGLLVGGNISAIGPDGIFNANSPTEELSALLRCCDLDPANWLGAEGLVLDEADCP